MTEPNRTVRLSPASHAVITALADTIIPSGEPGRPGAADMGLTDRLVLWLSEIPGAVSAFVFVAWCWEICPIWTGRLARFSRLPFEDRTFLFEQWEGSRFAFRRYALFGLKAIFMAAFYNNPAVWPHLGYEEGCLAPPPKPAEN